MFRLLRHVAASMAVSVPILLLALMPRASAEAHPAGAVTAARTSHALRGTFVPVTTGKLLFGAAALPRPTTVTVPKGLAQKVLTEAAAPGSGTADQLAPKPPTTSPYPHASVGFDISWPQCGSPLPGPQVVAPVGVNNGSAFTLNPCLSSEVAWAGSSLTLYTNLNSPTPHTDPSQWYSGPAGTCTELGCASWNYGYKSAQWAMQAARDAGASSKTWWLDVETSNIWSPNTEANDDVVAGAIAALRQAGAPARRVRHRAPVAGDRRRLDPRRPGVVSDRQHSGTAGLVLFADQLRRGPGVHGAEPARQPLRPGLHVLSP